MCKLTKLLLLIAVFGFSSCSKEDISIPAKLSLSEKVTQLIDAQQTTPQADDVQETNWNCSDWQVHFYNNTEKVGQWNGYSESIQESEKTQTYRFENGTFSVQGLPTKSNQSNSNTYTYQWQEEGNLLINNIPLLCREADNKLLLYFETEHNVAVGSIFNVTVSNTFGQSLQSEGNVTGLGMIQLSQNQAEVNYELELAAYDLVQKYHDRDELLGQVFNTIKVTVDAYQFILSDGSDQNDHIVQLSNQQVDLANVTPERARNLFEKFMKKQPFTFKGVDVNITKISHEDGSGGSFLVFGNTVETSEEVQFYFNTKTGKEHWLQAPAGTVDEMASYDLVQKFHDRDQILDQVFNTIKLASDAYQYILTDGADQEEHTIQLSNQQVDVANVTPERARNLFEKFMQKQAFTFKGIEVNITKISHEDGSGSSFLVFGTTANNEAVKFYYNTANDNEHWLQAPAGTVEEMASYDLAQKFHDRDQILSQVFNTIKLADDIYQFILTDGSDQQEHIIQVSNQQFDVANVTPERGRELIGKFMTREAFDFHGTQVNITRISHEDGSGGSFLVFGNTVESNEQVQFYYNSVNGNEHWLQAPTAAVQEIASYDLAQKFTDRTSMFGQVFNTIKASSDAYQFVLSNGSLQQDQVVQLSNQQVDVANVTPERARTLFEKFMKKEAFTFKGVELIISKIEHEDGSGGKFLVYGTTVATNEGIKFYQDTNSDSEHWLQAPAN